MKQRGIIGYLYIIAIGLLVFIIGGTLLYAKLHNQNSDLPSPSPSSLAAASDSPSPTPTDSPSPSPSATPTPSPTATPSPTPTPTIPPIATTGININRLPANYASGNHHIIVYGTGFQNYASVWLTSNGQTFSLVNMQSSLNQIEGDLPPGMPSGTYDVQVKNPDNTSATLSGALQITN